MTTHRVSSVHERPTDEQPARRRRSSCLTELELSDSATSVAEAPRIRDVAVAVLALALLIGCLLWAGGPPSRGGPPATGSPAALRAIDFNQPATLARSLQLVGPDSDALREVKCSARRRQLFVCHGLSPNGAEATVQILVANNGASWTSQ